MSRKDENWAETSILDQKCLDGADETIEEAWKGSTTASIAEFLQRSMAGTTHEHSFATRSVTPQRTIVDDETQSVVSMPSVRSDDSSLHDEDGDRLQMHRSHAVLEQVSALVEDFLSETMRKDQHRAQNESANQAEAAEKEDLGVEGYLDKMKGLYRHLKDDENFENWLELGVATKVDTDLESAPENKALVQALDSKINSALAADDFDEDLAKELVCAERVKVTNRELMSTTDAAGDGGGATVLGIRPNKRLSIASQASKFNSYIDAFVQKLDGISAPMTFADFSEKCSDLFTTLSKGDDVTEDSLAEGKRLLALAEEVSATAFSADWVLGSIKGHLDGMVAHTTKDAHEREEILSRCLVLRHQVNLFVHNALQIERRIMEYQDFLNTQRAAESALEALLHPIEEAVNEIYDKVEFPKQRRVMNQQKLAVESMVAEAVKFLGGFESSVSLMIPTHQAWKQTLLDNGYRRLQSISNVWMAVSMGYLDPVLKGTSRLVDRQSSISGMRREISFAVQIEWFRVQDGMPFEDIAFKFKHTKSSWVGVQLCMGARYLAKQTDPSYDEAWGFSY